MRCIIFTAGRQEPVKTLIFLLFMFVLIAQTAAPAAAEVNEWKISPENPTIGDSIKITGNADPNEKTDLLVTFEKEVAVSGGSYEYPLNDIIIPGGFDNRFTVEARGAEDLNVRIKIVLWTAMSSEATEGTATVSKSRVPPGTYPAKIDGKAKGSSVNLKITALQRIEADSEGKLSYRYNTKSIPPGKFDITLGGITKEITLSAKDAPPEEEEEEPTLPPVVPVPDTFEATPPVENESKPEEEATPSKEETIRKENTFKDKMNQKNLTEAEDTGTVKAEETEDKKENIYYAMGGIAAGLIVLFSYSRIKKTGKI